MSFASLVFRNLFRQRMRTLLTIVGIGVGITVVVALGAITGGLRQTVGGWLEIGGADFVVARKGSADFSYSTVSDEEWKALDALDGVARSTGALVRVTRHGGNPYFVLLGVRPDELAKAPPDLVSGPHDPTVADRADRIVTMLDGRVARGRAATPISRPLTASAVARAVRP